MADTSKVLIMVSHYPQAAGWNSGTSGFTSVHKIFVIPQNVLTLDGAPFPEFPLGDAQARSTCEICGQPVISTDSVFSPFRHMTSAEAAKYANGRDHQDD